MIALHAGEAMVVGVVVFLHVAAHAASVNRSARHRAGMAAPLELVYPAAWCVPGLVGGALVMFAALCVKGRGGPWEDEARLVMALLGEGAIASVLLKRFRVFPDGVERRTAWRPPAFFPWRDIAAVELRLDLGWLALRTRAGAQLRIAIRLQGMRTFAAIALSYLPREALTADPIARAWLVEQARGTGT